MATTAETRASGPTAEFFPAPGTEPGANTGWRVRVSLNGRLIHAGPVDPAAREEDYLRGGERYGLNWAEFDNLLGRLLTLCDATFADPVQRKAFKDMVRHQVKEWVAYCIADAAADAGLERQVSAPFVGGVLDQVGGLYGVEGEPTR